jgi:hypothetical protein
VGLLFCGNLVVVIGSGREEAPQGEQSTPTKGLSADEGFRRPDRGPRMKPNRIKPWTKSTPPRTLAPSPVIDAMHKNRDPQKPRRLVPCPGWTKQTNNSWNS